MTLVSQMFDITYNASFKIILNLMPLPCCLFTYLRRFTFILQPLLPSTHPVIFLGLVACAMSVCMLLLPGVCGKPQYDCIFINIDEHKPGMLRLSIARARLFFSIKVNHIKHSCGLVHWHSGLGDSVDENTGMWVIEPYILDDGRPQTAVIHLDTIVYLAHLLPIYGEEQAPRGVIYRLPGQIFHILCQQVCRSPYF